jgi:hypothetical protein
MSDLSTVISLKAQKIAKQNKTDLKHPKMVYIERKSSTRFWVWTKQVGSKWVVYEMVNYVDAAINENVWRISDMFLGDLEGNTPISGPINAGIEPGGKSLLNQISPMVNGVQWEYAVQPSGAPDFFGGFHGDEQLQSIAYFLNGQSISSPSTFGTNGLRKGARFEVAQKTFVYNPSGGAKVGEMFVRHIFTPEGLRVKWKLTWSSSLTVGASYGGMLPIKRNQTAGVHFVRYVDDLVINDCSATPHSRPGMNTTGVELYNNGNALTARVTIGKEFFNNYINSISKGIWVTDDPSYNKVYPTRIHSSTTATVTSGDIWECDALYEFFLPEA